MAVLEFSGRIKSITSEIDNRGFKSRFVRVNEPNPSNEKYSNNYEVQVTTDKYPLIDKLKAGMQVRVHANCRGSEYTNKSGQLAYGTNLSLWKIVQEGADTAEYNSAVKQRAENVGFQSDSIDDEDSKDLPF